MRNQKQIASKETSKPESYYFALQSSWGLTKHMGGLEATKELIELCHVNKNSYVLDVGCGVGITACYIAKEYGCKLIAIDISEEMIKRAEKRAKRKGVEDKVKFKVADAQALPFEDNLFDAVISESTIAFIKNKQKAINEYKRVAKPGGYVGFNEVTWIEPPPPELAEYLSRALGGAEFLTTEGWKGLLKEAGFSNIIARTHTTTAWRQWANEVKEIDMRDFLSAWGRFLLLYFKRQEVRKYIKEIYKPPKSIFRLFKYFGYGIYVGRK
jgi:SAM-dependent methyltransferase